jgi:hypothetical protein
MVLQNRRVLSQIPVDVLGTMWEAVEIRAIPAHEIRTSSFAIAKPLAE